MKIITAIIKLILSVVNGIYELFQFLFGFVDVISDVITALPFQLVSIISTFFVLIVAIVFYKSIK